MCGRSLSVFVRFICLFYLSVLSVSSVSLVLFHVRQKKFCLYFIQSIDEISLSVFLYNQLITTKTKTSVMKTFLEEWVKVMTGKNRNFVITGSMDIAAAMRYQWGGFQPHSLAGQRRL